MSRGTDKPQILPSTISGVSYHSTYKIVTLSRLQIIVSYVSRYSRYFTLHVQCLMFRGKYIATHKSKSTHQSVLCITVSTNHSLLFIYHTQCLVYRGMYNTDYS